MGDEAQVAVVGNSCESLDGIPMFRMAGVRTSFAISAQGEENSSVRSESAAPTDSEKKTFLFQPKEGEPLSILSSAVLQNLMERLCAISR